MKSQNLTPMKGFINKSGKYLFDGIGAVRVNVRLTACNVKARWKGGELVVSAPTGIEYDKLHEILRGFAPRLEECKPDSLYHIGQELLFDGMTVRIERQRHAPERILASFNGSSGSIEVGDSLDFSAPNTIKVISRILCRMAGRCAEGVLLPRAREVAREVGREPVLWKISGGHRTLGLCSSRGEISLSYALVFYPVELRDYVVKHELAHLSEMNHSPRFHRLCDIYCGGREKELEAKLRAFRVPIIR